MSRFSFLLPAAVLIACTGSPTTPEPPAELSASLSSAAAGPQTRSNGEPFEVTGIVTDERGVPLAGADVTMSHWLGGSVQRPSMLTTPSGAYRIAFASNPWAIGTTGRRGAARAEIMVDGYDWYWRTVVAASSPIVENFRLSRRKHITAGGSIELFGTVENGECLGWLAGPCARVRVAAPANGSLTIESIPVRPSPTPPQNELCCVDGNERYGNPATIPVAAGMEVDVEVAFDGAVIVKTSFERN